MESYRLREEGASLVLESVTTAWSSNVRGNMIRVQWI